MPALAVGHEEQQKNGVHCREKCAVAFNPVFGSMKSLRAERSGRQRFTVRRGKSQQAQLMIIPAGTGAEEARMREAEPLRGQSTLSYPRANHDG